MAAVEGIEARGVFEGGRSTVVTTQLWRDVTLGKQVGGPNPQQRSQLRLIRGAVDCLIAASPSLALPYLSAIPPPFRNTLTPFASSSLRAS